MGDFNHGHIQWNSLESTGIEDQQFMFLIQDSFLTQHVLEPTRGENVLDIVLSSQKELVDNVKIFEPLGNSDHNQIHFDINVKSESKNKKTYKRNFHKGNYNSGRFPTYVFTACKHDTLPSMTVVNSQHTYALLVNIVNMTHCHL